MASTPHFTHFEGGNALSAFRAQALLARLQQVNDRISSVTALAVHWVWTDTPLDAALQARFTELLTYGEPAAASACELFVVTPRLGTVSPWASKATDIARNCGLSLKRVERVLEYRVALKPGLLGGVKTLSPAERAACAALLHDRMTESVFHSAARPACRLCSTPRTRRASWATIDVLRSGPSPRSKARTTPRSAWRPSPPTRSITSSPNFKKLGRNPS